MLFVVCSMFLVSLGCWFLLSWVVFVFLPSSWFLCCQLLGLFLLSLLAWLKLFLLWTLSSCLGSSSECDNVHIFGNSPLKTSGTDWHKVGKYAAVWWVHVSNCPSVTSAVAVNCISQSSPVFSLPVCVFPSSLTPVFHQAAAYTHPGFSPLSSTLSEKFRSD